MVKLVSNRLNKSLNRVYSLSRKNKNETVLIWIFLDSDRINNYKNFLNLIPDSRNVGVIFRSKKIKKEYYNARELYRLCRKKKFTFLVSSSYVIAKSIGADGVHYPKSYLYSRKDQKLLITCSYHGYYDVKRIKQLNAKMVFISPIFLTNSNINKKERGIIKISFLANYIKTQYSVLGGVRESNIKLLRNRGINSISGLDFIFDIIKYKC